MQYNLPHACMAPVSGASLAQPPPPLPVAMHQQLGTRTLQHSTPAQSLIACLCAHTTWNVTQMPTDKDSPSTACPPSLQRVRSPQPPTIPVPACNTQYWCDRSTVSCLPRLATTSGALHALAVQRLTVSPRAPCRPAPPPPHHAARPTRPSPPPPPAPPPPPPAR